MFGSDLCKLTTKFIILLLRKKWRKREAPQTGDGFTSKIRMKIVSRRLRQLLSRTKPIWLRLTPICLRVELVNLRRSARVTD